MTMQSVESIVCSLGGISVLRAHVAVTGSTMDVARELLVGLGKDVLPVVVTAGSQSVGRGSRGRSWCSPTGNVYLTVGVPTDSVAMSLVPVLPLVVGTSMVAAIREIVPDDKRMQIAAKWPNDVLFARQKLSGTIVEKNDSGFLIGVGVNVLNAPVLSDGGRDVAALKQIFDANAAVPTVEQVASHCATYILRAVTEKSATRDDSVAAYRKVMDFGCTMFRRLEDGRRGAEVKALSIGPWGELRILDTSTGAEEDLVATYLFYTTDVVTVCDCCLCRHLSLGCTDR